MKLNYLSHLEAQVAHVQLHLLGRCEWCSSTEEACACARHTAEGQANMPVVWGVASDVWVLPTGQPLAQRLSLHGAIRAYDDDK